MSVLRIARWIVTGALALVIGVLLGAWVSVFFTERQLPETLALPRGEFIEADGLRLFVQEKGPATGPAILFVSGTLAWSETWRATLDPLAEAGFRTIAVDLPPFGLSEKPPSGLYGPQHTARRIMATLDQMHVERFVLVCHSIGCAGGVETTLRNPERVKGLVIADGALGHDQQAPDGLTLPGLIGAWNPLRTALMAMTYANPWFTKFGLQMFIHNDEQLKDSVVATYQYPLRLQNTSSAIGNWVFEDLLAYPKDVMFKKAESYPAFPAPVLVVWGREDTVTPLAQGEDIARRFPNAKLVVLEQVDHMPQIEEPEAFNAALLDFLAGLPSP